MNKEKWKDEVLKSFEGMERAKPSNDLFDKISSELENDQSTTISHKNVLAIAICILLLIVLNIFAISQYRSTLNPTNSETADEVNVQYALISDFNLYE
jgi:hypothetical protein